MRINPMNTMSFQAKIRPNNQNIDNKLTSQSVGSGMLTTATGSAVTSVYTGPENLATEQTAQVLNLIPPETIKFINGNVYSAMLGGLTIAVPTSRILTHLVMPKDPSESETLTKDDINLDEK